jgi:competence protein ComGC
MNETIPPITGNTPQPKTSTLAIWSVVLGSLSLGCSYLLTAIPAVICGHMALSRIKRSGGSLVGNGWAIAGLVTGYLGILLFVVALAGLLAAIAIPNFVKARDTAQTNMCINNLRQIDAAKQEWALENNKKGTDTPTQADVAHYLKNSQFPVCPAKGTYTIGPVDEPPTCSIPNHKLPQERHP